MDSLGARSDLLPAQENVVGVGPPVILRVGHGVEGADILRELVDDVQVLPEFFVDDYTEDLLILRADVLLFLVRLHGVQVALDQALLVIRGRGLEPRLQDGRPMLPQQPDGLCEGKSGAWVLPLQVLEGILRPDRLNLLLELGGEALKDVVEEAAEDVEHLMVVVLECHLEIEARKFRHVPVGEGPLGAEDGANLENPGHVRHQSHLLVELW
mmetsp:Transcript_38683/g.82283  ORF Transcript_38683/g.82283 Transcript_38683/m.82283 type:complete len:212 (-) Transcript_38683:960-1595(-)